MTRLSRIRRRLFPELSPALLAVVLLAAIAARVGVGSVVADDAYITFRYSENIASGNGFTYNPPARVLGTTTPLFTVMMTAAATLGCRSRPLA